MCVCVSIVCPISDVCNALLSIYNVYKCIPMCTNVYKYMTCVLLLSNASFTREYRDL